MTDVPAQMHAVLAEWARDCGMPELCFDDTALTSIEADGWLIGIRIVQEPVAHLLFTIRLKQIEATDDGAAFAVLQLVPTHWFSGSLTLGLDATDTVIGWTALPAAILTADRVGDVVFGLVEQATGIVDELDAISRGLPDTERQREHAAPPNGYA
ncbi:MAG: type III secretion system chaperone [Pseudomonadota bacterium]